MARELLGLHHVTAIAGDPQRNLDFYTGVLGLRLVKLTVNFDDPGTYHLYYGDYLGRPGTLLSFFPWPGMDRGRKGTGQATLVSFAIPSEALRYWGERLEDYDVAYEGPIARFDDKVLTFFDADDLQIELVAQRQLAAEPPARIGPVPPEYAIRRLCGVTLAVEEPAATASFLTELLGFRAAGQMQNRYRYLVGDEETRCFVDLLAMPGMSRGRVAVGNIHHVAWRTTDGASQEAWRQVLAAGGFHPTPVMDRQYFRAIYFRDPAGVLLEIATDPPGFATDESLETLGTHLVLPPWLEARREQLQGFLPPLRLSELAAGG